MPFNTKLVGKSITKMNAHCVVGVSMNTPLYDEEHMLSLVKYLSQRKDITQVTFLLADSLQLHNLKMTIQDKAEEELRQIGTLQGDKKLEMIEFVIWKLKKSKEIDDDFQYTFLRWDALLNDPLFAKMDLIINKEFENSAEFQKKINDTVSVFIQKIRKSGSIPEKQYDALKVKNLSQAFLLEELKVELILAKKGFDYEAYCGPRNSAAVYIHKNYIPEDTLIWKKISYVCVKANKKDVAVPPKRLEYLKNKPGFFNSSLPQTTSNPVLTPEDEQKLNHLLLVMCHLTGKQKKQFNQQISTLLNQFSPLRFSFSQQLEQDKENNSFLKTAHSAPF